MTLPIVVLPAAEADIRAAIAHFDDVRPGYGELFRLEVDRAFALIAHWPPSFERVSANLRRAVLHRFPYAVIYRPLPDYIRIIGVVSTRRDPLVLSELDERD
jgi:hypothetical protein